MIVNFGVSRGDEEDVDDFKYREGIQDKKRDKPPQLSPTRGKPERVSFPWKEPQKDDDKYSRIVEKCEHVHKGKYSKDTCKRKIKK